VNGAATVLPLPSGATGSSATAIAVSNGDVYVVGNAVEAGGDTAAYWVNDTLETLPTPSGWTDSLANAITVSGSDVYIAGNAYDSSTGTETAVYWVNGTPEVLPLPSGTTISEGNAIAISGSDVYVAGGAWDSITANSTIAAYWVNGTLETLPPPSGAIESQANAIAVSGGNVYVAGYGQNTSTLSQSGGITTIAAYWVNSTLETLPLPSGAIESQANAIAVSGGDVYVAGDYANSMAVVGTAVYWVNGAATVLPTPSGPAGSSGSVNTGIVASGIAVSDGDVYAVGYIYAQTETGALGGDVYTAAYWVNGTLETLSLPSGSTGALATGIAVSTQ
jgi:uncharacterized membrane protein